MQKITVVKLNIKRNRYIDRNYPLMLLLMMCCYFVATYVDKSNGLIRTKDKQEKVKVYQRENETKLRRQR